MKTLWAVLSVSIITGSAALSGQDPGSALADLARVKKVRSAAVTSSDPDFRSNLDRVTYIKPGETHILADIAGPGIIQHIWMTFNEARPNWLEKGGSARPDEIVLRMYWDEALEPAVEAPLGDFFAAGFGLRNEIRSLPVAVEGGDGYNCYWPMPFRKRAKITVTNEGKLNVRSFYYHLDYLQVDDLPEDSAYFCAQYRQEFPEQAGRDYLILEAEGRGHYVGTVMSARSRSPLWFGEGDVRIYVDGDMRPTIQGTGTEDYFLCAWGLEPCLYPFFGCTYMSSGFDDLGVRYTLYRWHILDPIHFTKSIRFTIEHTGWISADETETGQVDGHVEREDDIATVAFWYQIGQPKRFAPLPPLADRIFPELDLVIEGKDLVQGVKRTDGKVELQPGYDWTGSGQLLFRPDAENSVVELEFSVDREKYRGLILRFTQ
ncbi:MAG: glycoside hydrolase family 172 protein, partial [Acidobacteriota bacterium]